MANGLNMIRGYWSSGTGSIAGATARLLGVSRNYSTYRFRDAHDVQDPPGKRAAVAPYWLGLVLLLILFVCPRVSAQSVPPNTEITNVARAVYSHGNINIVSESNTVTVVTVYIHTQSTMEFLRYAPRNPEAVSIPVSTTYYSTTGLPSGPFEPLASPSGADGIEVIDLGRPVPLISAAHVPAGEPIFISIVDRDQNRDTSANETVMINLSSTGNGDYELLRLTETGRNSGIFTGYIQSGLGLNPAAYNGFVTVQEGNELRGLYNDLYDSQDSSSDTLTFIRAGTSAFIAKSAGKSIVSAGDYVQYRIKIENTTSINLDDISIIDNLPYSTRYQNGSTNIDGNSDSDPGISSDGKTLSFDPGILAPGQQREISYIIEIGPTAKPGKLTNSAYAMDVAGVVSNIVSATVRVREELFRSESFIAGQVVIAECDTSNADLAGQGIEGVRIYLEDGTYAVTDPSGMYHFEGIAPGTHVLQLDRDGLPEKYEVVSCDQNSQFAGSPYSRFVDIQAGMAWQADFQLRLKPRQVGDLKLKLSSGFHLETIFYRVDIATSVLPLRDLRVMVMLPEQLIYMQSSSRLKADPIEDPSVSGKLLTFNLGNVPSDWSGTLRFNATLGPVDSTVELGTECIMLFDTPADANQKSPVARNTLKASARGDLVTEAPIVLAPYFSTFGTNLGRGMKETLDDIANHYKDTQIMHIYITGHSDSSAINPRSRYIYPDNYALSLARAKAVAEYLAGVLNIDSSQFTVAGVGPDEPVADKDNPRANDLNRRVEIRIVSKRTTRNDLFDVIKTRDSVSVPITGLYPGEQSEAFKTQEKQLESLEDICQRRLEEDKPGFEWLWPGEDYNPPIPSVKVAIEHNPDQVPRLFLDGKEVSPLNFSETTISQSGSTAVSVWTGIDIHEGLNRFDAVAYSESEQKASTYSRSLHYSGPPVSVEVVDSLSYPVADGRRPAIIAIRFTDADGFAARPGVVGEWSVDPPYAAQEDIEELKSHPLLGVGSQRPKYQIGENGIALLELQATSESGEALLRFHLIDDEKEVRVRLRPKPQDWVLVGLAERTLGYNSVGGNRDYMAEAGVDNKTYGDGRASFFARGGIKGDKLLTLALDSRRLNSNPDSNFFGTINPESFYPLYGDGMKQGYNASSSRGVYAKIEAPDYYGLFGDYNTGLNATELSRYTRTFNGLKFAGGTEKRNLNMFLSRSNQAFARDEIQGNGTSGPYHLSRQNVAANTERIVLETRDRFQNDIVITSRRMKQFLDYTIDYYTGEIFFKMPIASRDQQFNPIFITIDYESNDPDDWSYNYGGRGAMDIIKNKLNIGGTYVHEGRIGGYGHLGSFDALYNIGNGLQLKTELAMTKVKEGSARFNGNAYLVEIRRTMRRLDGAIFVRDLDPDFGLGQQNSVEIGLRKYGANAAYRMRDYLILNGQVYRQSYPVSDSWRDLGELKINLTKNRFTAHSGIRYAENRLTDGTANRSCQLIAGGSYKIWSDRVEFRLRQEQSIVKNDDPDFPTRTTMGADYHVNRHLTFFGEQDFATGHKEVANDTRFGFKSSPWKGAQITSNIVRTYNENAERLFSNMGLIQAWQINDKLSADFSLDHGQLIRRAGDLSSDPNHTPPSGNPDGYTAVSVGASYREKKWSSAGRIEFRDSKSDDKLGITSNIFGEPGNGLGLLMAARIYKNKAATGLKKCDSDIRFGMAYRPQRSRWMAFNRLDFIFSTQKGGQFNYDNWRIVDNITANRRFSWRLNMALQYGAKYLRETIAINRYSGYMDLVGLESYYNLTSKWDLGARLALIHSWNLKQYQYGYGISSGYNVFKNAWMSTGYNFSGFNDKDFSEGNYTAKGPYVQFRFKFDSTTAKDIAARLGFFESAP